jgi:hypothetical protein
MDYLKNYTQYRKLVSVHDPVKTSVLKTSSEAYVLFLCLEIVVDIPSIFRFILTVVLADRIDKRKPVSVYSWIACW